jgi:hypothetical protein
MNLLIRLLSLSALALALTGCLVAPSPGSGERPTNPTPTVADYARRAVEALDAAAAEVDRIQADVEQTRTALAVAQEEGLDVESIEKFLAQRERDLATAQLSFRLAQIVAHALVPSPPSTRPATSPSH